MSYRKGLDISVKQMETVPLGMQGEIMNEGKDAVAITCMFSFDRWQHYGGIHVVSNWYGMLSEPLIDS